MEARTLKFSVNPDIIDKNINGIKDLGSGFIAFIDTLESLATAINDGWAFSYVFKDNHRKAENFLSSDLLIVDVDHGLKTQEALELPLVRDYCSMFYVTPSHTPDNHRFRLVFSLPRTITDPNELRAAARSLTQRIGGDISVTDPARLFYGCRDSQPLIFDKSMSNEFLDELIEDGQTNPASESIVFSGHTANRSELRLKPDMAVLLPGGQPIALQDIVKTTSIYCPFHHDHQPSAFVSISQKCC